MISAYTLPIISNSAEKREMLVRNTIAGLGINAVVGLQSNIGEDVGPTGHSNGILANIGTVQQKDAQRMPKFIVCLPPVNFKTEKDASMNKLDDYLREQI